MQAKERMLCFQVKSFEKSTAEESNSKHSLFALKITKLENLILTR